MYEMKASNQTPYNLLLAEMREYPFCTLFFIPVKLG